MYQLKIVMKDGRKIERTAAYSPKFAWSVFDAWRQDTSVAKVELFNPKGERIAVVKRS
jgi:hypothetical protein